jgi:hypothetical protein
MFCATNECDSEPQEWCFFPKSMITTQKKKSCDTNKNMIKMGVIIKGVYCIINLIVDAWKKI